jgi:hypothetical protein
MNQPVKTTNSPVNTLAIMLSNNPVFGVSSLLFFCYIIAILCDSNTLEVLKVDGSDGICSGVTTTSFVFDPESASAPAVAPNVYCK